MPNSVNYDKLSAHATLFGKYVAQHAKKKKITLALLRQELDLKRSSYTYVSRTLFGVPSRLATVQAQMPPAKTRLNMWHFLVLSRILDTPAAYLLALYRLSYTKRPKQVTQEMEQEARHYLFENSYELLDEEQQIACIGMLAAYGYAPELDRYDFYEHLPDEKRTAIESVLRAWIEAIGRTERGKAQIAALPAV